MSSSPRQGLSRRSFLGVGGGALLCTVGGKQILARTPEDVAEVDRLARAAQRPKPAAPDPVDQLRFPTPEPAPGGSIVEYWIQARAVTWDIVPSRKDDWMGMSPGRRTKFRAFCYQEMTTGFAGPKGPPTMPGPLLQCEVGDLMVVHFRNSDEGFDQAVTMHPHGVTYNPEYDGAYLGRYTRAGGFISPGEEFTYRWLATPDSVGAWPYHDHGPNHTLNSKRGLFGALVVREKGAPRPDVEVALALHSFTPPLTGIQKVFHTINGRAFAGNTPTIKAKVGQDVAMHVLGLNDDFHTFHVHGHRWKDPAGAWVDSPTVGPSEVITARWREDNPGRWLYHCHVFTHMDMGMAGWYEVMP
jgi:FtsP/CotA-like multicopper oxidase with cupredoxin domain